MQKRYLVMRKRYLVMRERYLVMRGKTLQHRPSKPKRSLVVREKQEGRNPPHSGTVTS